MELESSYQRNAVGGAMQLLPDPIIATPPLALNPWHVLHPEGRAWRLVRLGPVTSLQPGPQRVKLAVWGWYGTNWSLLHDGVEVWAQHILTIDRADAAVLRVPTTYGSITALCCLPRPSFVDTDAYWIHFAGVDTPRWPC